MPVQFPAVIDLWSLNGMNGFKIKNGHANDCTGCSVSGIGDVNDDGVADFLIGAYALNSFVGPSYVVFGKVGLGSNCVF